LRQGGIRRPRVRARGGAELGLPNWTAIQKADLLSRWAFNQMLIGVAMGICALGHSNRRRSRASAMSSAVTRKRPRRTRAAIVAARLHVLLRREGVIINHKKLRRLYREERLQVGRRGGRKRALGIRAPMTLPPRWSLSRV
jgi:hypothetical protein